ncbi:hypothetical protein Q4512_00435 [Oceanihabitans sp. 2_MG-2023]|uniref:hypothetical protein n=1 Tax=Oceanihabitans sp. 2_MG-2023 TaxID=3062661 RepID=UPI0026E41EBD|nr:hypothetical protein [Oceanihabitans sp. 2_MG-2023]MDO6595357.1 hypothetical protein [Oceanihabitans sp. 2_MG-2023]
MIKKLVIVFIAFFAIQSFAQEGTSSPYSFYGIGSLKFKGTVENRSMGGLSIYTDSTHVNLRNPASYGGDDLSIYNNEGRPMTFSVGGGHTSTKLKNASDSDRTSTSTFDYIAISLPLGKLGVGFGLMPYTSVGYKLENYGDDGISTKYKGEGGVNKTYFSAGYQITKDLSFGVDLQYNFGNIEGSTVEYVYNDGDLVQYQTREDNRSDLSGLSYNLGVSYKTKLNKNLELVSGVTFSPKSDLKSKNQRAINTITIDASTEQEFVINTLEVNLQEADLKETDLVIPAKFSFGVGLGQPRKWFVGVESVFQETSKFSNALYASSSAETTYENANTFSFGGFYIPDYNAYRSYLKRVVYRAGFRTEKTGLVINGESINEFGISFGVGLPVGNILSNANLGFEIGKRGTTDKNLIQENFINFQLSLSLNDRWFQKSKYD